MKQNLSTLIALALVSGSALAQTAAPAAPEPESTLAFNVGAVSEYRYRGISQSRLQPALQGGADYSHKSGLYVGAWASSIKWIKDAGASDGSLELDIYGGYKGAVGDLAYDVGFLRYEYVGNKYGNVNGFGNANTDEVYGAITYGVVTAKYSYSLSNLFGNLNSKGSYYADISANLDLGEGYSLTPHVGYQYVKNTPLGSYTDYSLTLTKDLGNGLAGTAMWVNTNADPAFGYITPSQKSTGKAAVVVGLKYTF
jgi:uncharacterized protein (TIGR02001 family)